MKFLIVIALLCGLAAAQILEIINEEDPAEYTDCHAIKDGGYSKNGTYLLTLNETKFVVPCEFHEDFVYLIILRRIDGLVDFGKTYNEYRRGFGHTLGDYFAGLDYIHKLTYSGNHILDVHILDWANRKSIVTYNYFFVGNYYNQYELRVSGYKGHLKDDLSYSTGMKFYTLDKPDPYNCVHDMRGGWWYRHCTKTLPTGHYYKGYYHQKYRMVDGIFWMDYISPNYSLKRMYLTIRKR